MTAKARVESDPFDEGCRAAAEGIPAEANPYPAGSGKYALWQDGHEVGRRHRRGGVARAGGRAGADGVHAQLLAELAAELGALARHQALAPTSASRLDSRSENRSRKDFANFSTPSRSSVSTTSS